MLCEQLIEKNKYAEVDSYMYFIHVKSAISNQWGKGKKTYYSISDIATLRLPSLKANSKRIKI